MKGLNMQKINACQYAGLTLTVVSLFLVLGCENKDNLVVIKYRQVANWYEYKEDNAGSIGSESAGKGMFMMYRIDAIENKSDKAVPFKFEVARVYAKDIDDEHDSASLAENNLLNKATDKTVNAGETLVNPGCIILRVADEDPQSLKNVMIYLNYNVPSSGQSVLTERNSSNVSVDFFSPGTEKKLRNLCPL
jgi:hypothetical protein